MTNQKEFLTLKYALVVTRIFAAVQSNSDALVVAFETRYS